MLHCFSLTFVLPSEKGFKAVPTEAVIPVVSTPIRGLDKLFFIEQPKNISVIESKLKLSLQSSGPVHVD